MTIIDQLRREGFTSDQIARMTIGGKPIAEAEAKPATAPDRMNKTERLYSWELELQRQEGTILAWKFGSLKFRLARATWYTPDFCVWLLDGRIRLIEIKGGHIRDDAAVKFKTARESYPDFDWRCLQRVKGGWRELFT